MDMECMGRRALRLPDWVSIMALQARHNHGAMRWTVRPTSWHEWIQQAMHELGCQGAVESCRAPWG